MIQGVQSRLHYSTRCSLVLYCQSRLHPENHYFLYSTPFRALTDLYFLHGWIHDEMLPHGESSKEKEMVTFAEKTIERRYLQPLCFPTELDALTKAAEGVVPVNTKRSTNWTVRALLSWIDRLYKECKLILPCHCLCKPAPSFSSGSKSLSNFLCKLCK